MAGVRAKVPSSLSPLYQVRGPGGEGVRVQLPHHHPPTPVVRGCSKGPCPQRLRPGGVRLEGRLETVWPKPNRNEGIKGWGSGHAPAAHAPLHPQATLKSPTVVPLGPPNRPGVRLAQPQQAPPKGNLAGAGPAPSPSSGLDAQAVLAWLWACPGGRGNGKAGGTMRGMGVCGPLCLAPAAEGCSGSGANNRQKTNAWTA